MKLFKAKTLIIILISLVMSFAGLAISLLNPGFLKPIQNIVFDGFQKIKPRESSESAVVILSIDEESIKTFGQWPWPRNRMAELVEKITNAGAAAIGFDLVFSEPDRSSPKAVLKNLPENLITSTTLNDLLSKVSDSDETFASAIANAPVALSFFNEHENGGAVVEKKAGISWLGENVSDQLETFEGSVASLPILQKAAMGQGHVTLSTTRQDDIVRSVPLFTVQRGKVFPAFSIETLRIALQNATGQLQSFVIKTTHSGSEGGDASGASGHNSSVTAAKVGDFVFPLDRYGKLTVYYAKDDPEAYISAKDVVGKGQEWLVDKFEGKIVLVGASAVGLRDIRKTSLRQDVPGVSIHKQIIDQIVSGDLLQRPDWIPGAETFLAIFFTFVVVLLVPVTGAIGAALIGAICAGLIGAICWFAFSKYGYLLDPTPALAISFAAYLMMTTMMYFFSEREKRFVRNAFQHYLAPDLLARLEEDPKALELGGEIRQLTLMFMDIRGFTKISETLNPEQLVHFLNTLLSPLSDIIQDHEGAIDKYIGDSIMAFWNAPLDVADHPKKACRAALMMLEKVHEMNRQDAFGFKSVGLGDVAIGIGINTGEGCVGNMGSSSRFDYSVIGDAVNIAARLETTTKEVGWPILLSQETADNCGDFARLSAGRFELKGKSEPQQVFALLGDETYAAKPSYKSLEELYSKKNNSKPGTGRSYAKKLNENPLVKANPQLQEFLANQ